MPAISSDSERGDEPAKDSGETSIFKGEIVGVEPTYDAAKPGIDVAVESIELQYEGTDLDEAKDGGVSVKFTMFQPDGTPLRLYEEPSTLTDLSSEVQSTEGGVLVPIQDANLDQMVTDPDEDIDFDDLS